MIYVINLAFREDRRAEMQQQLQRVGLGFDHPKVTLFRAIRPYEAGEFPNIGSKGCFLSHLSVLRDAQAKNYDTILVLEDDADFICQLCCSPEQAHRIQSMRWDLFFLGQTAKTANKDAFYASVPPDHSLKRTHATLIRPTARATLVPYLEAMLLRKSGDSQGGPMHIDGALNWYRRDHPALCVYAVTRRWVVQRSSRTDIHPVGWKERVPLINLVRRFKNFLARK